MSKRFVKPMIPTCNESNVVQTSWSQFLDVSHRSGLVIWLWMFSTIWGRAMVFNIYDITSIFLREPTPKKFTYLVSMNLFIYNFLDRVPKGPYFLSNMHLIGVSTCIYNNKQQHIFEGQVLRVSSSGYLSISGLHGIHYYMIALSFLSNFCIMWYVVYHTLVFNEFS